MRKITIFLVVLVTILLSSCADASTLYNFEPRKDTYMFSEDESIIIYYKTNNDGKLIELNIDRLLTIEEMILMNPVIDTDYELEGFEGDIFMEPSNTCTDISNDVLIPINIEVGNTRYKFDDDDCMYKTVDKYNEFKPGHADEYLLTDTITVASHVTVSIIVYNPTELINFVELYEIPTTYKTLGVSNILINSDRDDYEYYAANYYKDIKTFEQLYLKHQEAENSISEIMGVSTDINLMDINSLMEIVPLVDQFDVRYESEITAIEELQELIGIAFGEETESVEDEEEPEEDSEGGTFF